jgi:N-acetylneuraminic acid mutarotase
MKFVFKILAFITLLLTINIFSQFNKWEIVGYMPYPLSGSEAVVVDTIIYVIGGRSDSLQTTIKNIYAFNPKRNTWSLVGNLKKSRRRFLSVYENSKIFSVGGEENPNPNFGYMEFFNLNNSASSMLDSNKKFSRNYLTGTIKNGLLYIVGGFPFSHHPGTNNPYIVEYNTVLKSVTYNYDSLFSGNKLIYSQMSSFINDNIFIFGGLYNTVLNSIYRYNTTTHTLKTLNQGLLQPRANGRAVLLQDSNIVFLIGGYNEQNRALNSVESYKFIDMNNVIRNVMPSLNYRRRDFMAVYYDKYIYVFGGVNENFYPVRFIERFQILTDIEDENSSVPSDLVLKQNYPNPFNPSTTIEFSLDYRSSVTLNVYDVLGVNISNLLDEEKPPGIYKVNFDAAKLAGGIYFCVLKGTKDIDGKRVPFVETKKMILLK